jgi:hypothetical protein
MMSLMKKSHGMDIFATWIRKVRCCMDKEYCFDEIDVNAGKGYKDFGKGFYATAIASHADRLAIRNKGIAERRQAFLIKKNNKKH